MKSLLVALISTTSAARRRRRANLLIMPIPCRLFILLQTFLLWLLLFAPTTVRSFVVEVTTTTMTSPSSKASIHHGMNHYDHVVSNCASTVDSPLFMTKKRKGSSYETSSSTLCAPYSGDHGGRPVLMTQISRPSPTSQAAVYPRNFLAMTWYYAMLNLSSHAAKANGNSSNINMHYNWDLSTEDNYRESNVPQQQQLGDEQQHAAFYGKYRHVRRRLDYTYHAIYSQSRQLLQDKIIDTVLLNTAKTSTTGGGAATGSMSSKRRRRVVEKNNRHPWILFTAGVMGAGKSYTTQRLQQEGKLPLGDVYVKVDPDEIRTILPEYATYVTLNAETAGEYTQKEAGMIAEIITEVALDRGINVLVDGSLSDSKWYTRYFEQLRNSYKKLHIGIVHVTAPLDTILHRIVERAKITGRMIPQHVLLNSIESVPRSVQVLRDQVDFFVQIVNNTNDHNAGAVGSKTSNVVVMDDSRYLQQFQPSSTSTATTAAIPVRV